MTATLFAALVVVMAVVVFSGLYSAGAGLGVIAGIGVIYLAVPAFLASRGALDRYNPLPAPALVMVLVLTAITLTITLSQVGDESLTPSARRSFGSRAFRIAVEWLLHRPYQEGDPITDD